MNGCHAKQGPHRIPATRARGRTAMKELLRFGEAFNDVPAYQHHVPDDAF